MRILFDTSSLVGAMLEGHPSHSLVLPWLQRVKAKVDVGLVAAHTLAELYAILTRLPVSPRIPPALALQLIQYNVLDTCEVVTLSDADYVTLLHHLAGLGIAGGPGVRDRRRRGLRHAQRPRFSSGISHTR